MDAVSDPAVRHVCVMSAAQIGKTEAILNIIGFHVDQDPAPILVIQPTQHMGQAFSKDRLAPMLRDTARLRGKVKEPRARDSGNTTLHKVFPGGHITIAGANSAAGLASRPIRIVLCDEIDRYPPSAGSEGDPVQLAAKRASTFWNAKLVTTSTPTVKGGSRIEADYENSDKREYFVPCPHCKEMQVMRWDLVQWEKDKPETAAYFCDKCGAAWTEADRMKAVRQGEWRAGAEFNGVAGFRLSGLYSPWVSLPTAAREFLEAKKQPQTLRVWVNTFLGDTWEDSGEGVDSDVIQAHREPYDASVELPEGVLLITAGLDVQDDRLEAEIVGWGLSEESWSLSYDIVFGDPGQAEVWQRMDDLLQRSFNHPRMGILKVAATCVDSGGHFTQEVYKFCKPRLPRRVWAVKGMGGEGRAIMGRPSRNNVGKVYLFPIGVDTAKEIIYSRLEIHEAGPGYCHFPSTYDDEYFLQLAAEKVVTKYSKGFPRRVWVKTRRRNEALDCRVYAYAAFVGLNARLDKIADRRGKRAVTETKTETEKPDTSEPRKGRRVATRRKAGGFVNGWRA